MEMESLTKKTWWLLVKLSGGKWIKVSNLLFGNFFLVEDLIIELDPDHSGTINEEEFMLILKYIEQKNNSQ